MKHHLLHWTTHMTLLVIVLLLYNLRYGYGATISPTLSSISTNDTLKSHLLNEVNVFSSPIASFYSEEPRVKHNNRIEITNPYEIGLGINDKDLIGKRLQNISIHFNRKLPNGYQFQVHIFTVDSNGLPSTRLNTHDLLYYKYDANWNNFYLEHDDIVIPESGLAFIIGLVGQPKELVPKSKISLGRYRSPKKFYLKVAGSHNGWIGLKAFKQAKIGPMIRVSATSE